tara:strand:+ start:367 stop:1038 length:672 start_codon:yes stop_codon:yes gene_type:complete
MKSTIATILGTSILGLIKSRMGSGATSSSVKILPCDEIKLDMVIKLHAQSFNLDHIQAGWSAHKMINQMNIIDISIKCVAQGLDEPYLVLEEEYIYGYFEVFIKLKGKFTDLEGELTRDNTTYKLILDTIKEIWVENILSISPDAQTEIQVNNKYDSYFSADEFINSFWNWDNIEVMVAFLNDINAAFYGSRTSILQSFYVTDEKGNPIDYTIEKDKSKLRKL